MKRALILIDIQNVYFKEGNYHLSQPELAAEKAYQILEIFRKNNAPIIHVGHLFYNEDQSEKVCDLRKFYEKVKPQSGEIIIMKEKPNSFLNTRLKEELVKNKAEQLVICGMMSHMCIDTTVRACQDYGYPVVLIEDACTTKELSFQNEMITAETVHKVFMAALNGTFATVMKAEEWKDMNDYDDYIM